MKKHLKIAALFSCAVLACAGLVLWLAFDDPAGLLARNGVITPVAFLAAAFANATAVGGGFLFIPLFIFVYGLTAIEALKLSLATQAFGMTSGALGWSFKFILGRMLLLACAGSFVGMALGTYFWVIPNGDIKMIFGWVNIAIGLAILLEMTWGRRTQRTSIQDQTPLKAGLFVLACVGGGLINSWVSIGVGEVVALYLMFVYKMRIDYAIATGVAALALDSILGFIFHIGLGGIRWDYLIFTVPGVIIGGRYGAKLGRWVERQVDQSDSSSKSHRSPLKWTFTGIVVLDGIIMLVQVYSVS